MGSKICMNELCRATTSSECKKGWGLKSGGFAILCYRCGSAYENSIFCESFHQEESGWRACRGCGKRIHCGCIASRFLYEYMDFGGVECINCAKHMEINLMQSMQIPGVAIPNGSFVTNSIGDVHPTVVESRINDENFSMERLLQLTKTAGANEPGQPFHSHKRETMERKRHFATRTQRSGESSAFTKTDNSRPKQGAKDVYESMSQPHLNISLSTPLDGNSCGLPFGAGNAEGSEQSKGSSAQGQRPRNILLKPLVSGSEQNKGSARVARPPAEGWGRNQLLPRYWPRITEQELQQLSGDLKSPIIPLFEKVLSASDAGRIGRLVLPKACAEAYFPPINQSEGIPIRIQDIKGNEWSFQFRFWPNNNSRMYVLEGVTPCIQSLQVRAGDTVTFSRRDPGGQLVIGCRKATNVSDMQDSQTPTIPHGGSPGEMSVSGHIDNLITNGGRTSEDSMQRSTPILEKKKVENIKNKRLLMHNDEAMELRVTWEEAQELFCPCPASNPTVVMIEDHAFEEFEEPPIFGKRTFFTSSFSGEQEQLAQCDSCSKWRRLPLHALLSAKWTCSENTWDSSRSSCAALEDINPGDLDAFFRVIKDSKRRRIADNRAPKEGEPSGLDALATAAVLGDNMGELGESSVGVTTKHPRHRPGCSCIVCIQPPSGKGKHQPTCKCNVCSTVRRRFKTLMMRKKKRKSEREAELLVQAKGPSNDDIENEKKAGHALLRMIQTENAGGTSGNQLELAEANKGHLDLNSDPNHEDDMLKEAAGMSLTALINAASLPLDMYFGPNRVGPGLLSQAVDKSDGYGVGGIASRNEAQNKGEDG
ncbi:B3 domain-containing transcription repressor VAL1-like [Olea europaea subsp. europaea]|uniref:B3 domain-containing transcription repressor VAL1-like n=1 Tax=Olea europaea subsp. europaea TaxID=158383 RepID=A0A8S0Q758_OLEEU|nr:B3 domain-containing transcription repressor VAL1-like [Olea europaea subsp. europaea]